MDVAIGWANYSSMGWPYNARPADDSGIKALPFVLVTILAPDDHGTQ